MFRTEICDLLEIEYPILQGGMVWVSYHELCAAVSEAGGLGTLAGGSMTPDELKKEIGLVKEMTNKPFGVNVPILSPYSEALVRVAVDEKVKVISTSAGNPKRFTAGIQDAGIKVIHVAPSATLGMKAAQAGVDAVVAEGTEAGGHNGFEEITTMALVPQMVDRLSVPVIAAGGVADGRGFVAAMALGAKGVQIGTRFAATHEAMGHPKFKKAILDADDRGTVLTGRILGPVRCVRNPFAEKVMEAEGKGMGREELLALIGRDRSKRATLEGDVEDGTIYCGQIAGLLSELKSARDVVLEIMGQATTLAKELGALSGK